MERSRLGEKSRSTGAQSFSQLVQVLRVREGAQPPHRARNPDQSASNDEIAADYVFLRDVSVADQASQCWLVGRDRGTGCSLPMRSLTKELALNGWHSRWLVTSVNAATMEEWIFGVIRSPRYRIRCEKSPDLPTVLEASPVGDSQSNGFVERAVRSVEDPQDRAGS